MDKKAKRITQTLVVATTCTWIIWDLLVYFKVGGPATISTCIGELQAVNLFVGLLLACGFGVLVGHLIQMVPSGDPYLMYRWVAMLVGLVVGIWVTPR